MQLHPEHANQNPGERKYGGKARASARAHTHTHARTHAHTHTHERIRLSRPAQLRSPQGRRGRRAVSRAGGGRRRLGSGADGGPGAQELIDAGRLRPCRSALSRARRAAASGTTEICAAAGPFPQSAASAAARDRSRRGAGGDGFTAVICAAKGGLVSAL